MSNYTSFSRGNQDSTRRAIYLCQLDQYIAGLAPEQREDFDSALFHILGCPSIDELDIESLRALCFAVNYQQIRGEAN